MRVLITGANRGIGAGLAKAYLKAGHSVIGTARNVAGLTPDIEWLALDVTAPANAMQNALADRPLDLLICNAGVYPDKGLQSASDYTADIWAAALTTNVTGVFLTVQAALPNLRLAKGRIAVISSIMASSAGSPGGSYAYRASKAAVTNLACNLATDLKLEGIAVGSYHPGWVRTEMGGNEAEISLQESVAGLVERVRQLSLENTGVFEGYDGETIAF